MDKELEKYYENYFDLFASQGWKQFIEDMEANRLLMSDIRQVRDADSLHFHKGQLNIVDKIVGFENAIELAWKEMQPE